MQARAISGEAEISKLSNEIKEFEAMGMKNNVIDMKERIAKLSGNVSEDKNVVDRLGDEAGVVKSECLALVNQLGESEFVKACEGENLLDSINKLLESMNVAPCFSNGAISNGKNG